MFRAFTKTMILLTLGGASAICGLFYLNHTATERKLRAAEARNAVLTKVVERLGNDKRVADVLVTDQKAVDGVTQTTLLFVETARDATTLPPRTITVRGKMIHVSAQVIRFEKQFVEEGDPLRGHSIAMFTGIYGDQQKPTEAVAIDEPGTIPAVYRGEMSDYEKELWKDFWKLFQDPQYRKLKGVETTFGQDVWGPLEPGKLYTVTLAANAGLSLTSGPVPAIYQEALKRARDATTQTRTDQ